jgi:hypothetical protein
MSAKKTPPAKEVCGILIAPSGEVTSIEAENTLRALWDVVGGYVERTSALGWR